MLPALSDPSWKVAVIAVGVAVAVSVALYWFMVRPEIAQHGAQLATLEKQWDKGARTTEMLARTVMSLPAPMPAPAPPPPPPPAEVAQAPATENDSTQ